MDIFKGLLGKQSTPGTSWGELAGMYFSGQGKQSNRARNLLFASLFFNLKEAKMQSNVLKNLEESERKRVFDEADVTNKWNSYNSLMDDDAAFKKDPNYFRYKAEEKFTKVNPNFPTGNNLLQSQLDFRNTEIRDYEEALKNNHLEKIKTGDIQKRLSKEEFFKPFEDFYVSEKERIAAPKNVSLIHKGWDFITGGKKKELTESQLKDARNVGTRNTFGYLLDPDEFTAQENIELYRDPNTSVMSATEVKRNIIATVKDSDLARSMINNMDPNKQSYTKSELDGFIITETVDFDALAFKFEEAGKTFDKTWEKETGKKIPVQGSPDYLNYKLRRTNFSEERAGVGDKDTIELRKKVYLREDLLAGGADKNDPVIKALDAQIRNSGIDNFKLMLFKTGLAAATDPEIEAMNSKRGISQKDYLKEFMGSFDDLYKIFEEL